MDIDEFVQDAAERQYGAVAVWQIAEAGFDRNLRYRRVGSGRWVMATPRVVRLRGAPADAAQALMVNVLDAGRHAMASHQGAAWWWSIPSFGPATTVIRERTRNMPSSASGHRPVLLLPSHRTVVRGIPCTTLPRTLIDLGSVVHPDRLERIVDNVIAKSPAMLPALHTTFNELAKRGRTGIAAMRRILAERPPGTVLPASGLERRFEEILKNAGERPLRRQVDVGGESWLGRVDYFDDEHLFLVEIDSELHHTSLSDKRRDRERDIAMLAAGYRKVVRITDVMVWQRPWEAVEAVRDARRAMRFSA